MIRTITVKGVGTASVKPDYITLTMTIETQDKSYNKAMLDASKRIEMIQKAVEGIGYVKEDVKTLNFNVDTRYENIKDRQGNYRREFTGYACTYHLKLAFDFESKQLAKALSSVALCGANPELNIAFTVKNPAKVSEDLLVRATENAQKKAVILCRASNAELGQLLSIDYNWGELNVISNTRYAMEDLMMPCAAMNADYTPEIEPDDIDVRDTVTFVWEIR